MKLIRSYKLDVIGIALLLVTGCSPKQQTASNSVSAPPSTPPVESKANDQSGAKAPPKVGTESGEEKGAPTPTSPALGDKKPAGGTVPPRPGEEWQPAPDLAPAQAAKKIDQRLSSLSGVKVQVHYELRNPAGAGFGDPVLKIKDPKTFSFAYPSLQNGVLTGALARADGKTLVQKLGPQVTETKMPIKAQIRAPADVEKAWVENPGREVLSGFLQGRSPFSELVGSLPKRGYSVSIKKRTLRDFPGHVQYMLQAERPASSKAGKSQIEVIMDGRLFVPMSFLIQTRKPKATMDSMFLWRAGWLHNQSFDSKEFNPKVLAG